MASCAAGEAGAGSSPLETAHGSAAPGSCAAMGGGGARRPPKRATHWGTHRRNNEWHVASRA
eukprot:2255648-Alexandrium_andersonii.AAC.1